MSKPTFVCVPGAWHTPDVYNETIAILHSDGYPAVGIPLPSAGAVPPHKDFTGDVDGIRQGVLRLVEGEGKDVVLVMHSYTGMPGAEAVKGLGKSERSAKGLEGGIVRLVFIMAIAMSEGFCLTGTGAPFPEWMKIDTERGVATVDPEDAKQIFYHDLTESEGDMWAAKLQHQSLGVYDSKAGYAGWRDIPSTFVIANNDRSAVNKQFVEFMIAAARKEQPMAFDQVEECDGGHCLMLSHPQWLASVLKRGVEDFPRHW